jgi:hypothetical protein
MQLSGHKILQEVISFANTVLTSINWFYLILLSFYKFITVDNSLDIVEETCSLIKTLKICDGVYESWITFYNYVIHSNNSIRYKISNVQVEA